MDRFLSRDQAIQHLSRELLQHPVPSACPLNLLGLAHYAGTHPPFETPPIGSDWMYDPSLDTLWSTAVEWISMPRTTTEIQAIIALECRCEGDERSHPLHQHGYRIWETQKNMDERPILSLMIRLSAYVVLLERYPEGNPRHTIIYTITGDGQWPRAIEQIMPHGPEDTIRGFLVWFKGNLSPKTMSDLCMTIRHLIKIAGSCILPSIIAHTTLCSELLRNIHAAVEVFKAGEQRRWRYFWKFCYHAISTGTYLLLAVLLDHSNTVQRRYFIKGSMQDILDVISSEYSVIGSLKNMFSRNSRPPAGIELQEILMLERILDAIGGALFEEYPHLRSISIYSIRRRRWEDAAFTLNQSPSEGLWTFLIRLLDTMDPPLRCQRPGCTGSRTESNALKHCAGCRRVVYCSSRCQKLAWRFPAAPHRLVCGALRFICRKFKLPKHRRVGEKIHFPPEGESHVSAARVILDHFAALTRAEMVTAREI
jgi:hypothetical protein